MNVQICILEIDVVGAQKVFKSGQDCFYVFVEPPSLDILKERLIGRYKSLFLRSNKLRGTDQEKVIELRMKNALEELDKARNFGIYQNFILNNELNEAFKSLLDFINRNYKGLNLSEI